MTNSSDSEDQPGFIPPHGGCRELKTYQSFAENAPPEVAAHTLLCLVHQTSYPLDQQLRQMEQAFLQEGGFTERLYKARQQTRALAPRPTLSRTRANKTNPSNPACPPGRGTSNPPYAR